MNRTVSHYRILGPLGSGGMGVVYEAEDTRLGRRVAVKFVPPGLADDEQALARFLREARAASALNHPHICSVFDVGEDGGQPFLVMEKLEGRTLKGTIAGKPLPADRVLKLGAQMAEALEAAHGKGIVHRDIKPGNVFLTRRGDVKLLDFGLAKLSGRNNGEPGDIDAEEATETGRPEPLTGAGTAPGTAAYMSPEQARGEEVDARTDLFSLGAVLYEMTTGKRPFPGETPAVLFEGILAREPAPPSALIPDVPYELDAIVLKALEKDRDLRYQTAADLRVDLQRAARRRGSTRDDRARGLPRAIVTGTDVPAPKAWRRSVAAVAIGLIAVVAGALALQSLWERSQPRFTQLTFRRGIVTSARFSPDGHTVVYSALWDGKPPEIFSRRLEGPASVSLGLPPATLLSVSSRGELAVLLTPSEERGVLWLGTLARVPLSGGPVRPVLEGVLDADWSPDGRELAIIRWHEGQFQLEYPPGTVLLRPSPSTRVRISPDGSRVAVLDDGGITLVDRGGNKSTLEVAPLHQRLAWSARGESILLDAGESDLRRTLRRVTLNGAVDEVCALAGTLVVHDVARDGRVLLHHGFERWGVRARAPGEAEEHDASAFANSAGEGLSADGSQILLWDGGDGPPGSALLCPTRGGPALRLGEGRASGLSDDGRWVVMGKNESGRGGLTLVPTGTGEPRPVPVGRLERLVPAWHVDEHGVGFQGAEPGRPQRSFYAEVPAGPARAVTPEGSLAMPGFLQGRHVLAASASTGSLALFPLAGGEPQPLDWRLPPDPFLEPVRVGADGRHVFVRRGSVPARIERIDLRNGQGTPWKTLSPSDSTGVGHIWSMLLTPSGDGYAYTHGFYLQDLFLVNGLP